ncbi:MAG: hypothetical protein RR058_01485 [Oscillospiraceae bacterium]
MSIKYKKEKSSDITATSDKTPRTKKQHRIFKTLLSKLVTLAVVVILVVFVLPKILKVDLFGFSKGHDAVLSSDIIHYTAADFIEAVLGTPVETSRLVVCEIPVKVSLSLTDSFANIGVFTKTQLLHTEGTGFFAVDLGALTKDDISVDAEARCVFVKVARPTLYTMTYDPTKTTFEDTQKGLLAFGDISMTTSEHNVLDSAIYEKMKSTISTYVFPASDSAYARMSAQEAADSAAQKKVSEIYALPIKAVSEDYKVLVEFK